MKRIILPLTIIALLLLLFVGCNEDNAGLFKQVSDSEPKTKLGSIQILGIKDTTLYALTSVKGLHKYDTTTKTWSNIPSTQVIHATYDSVNNNLIYAQRATGDTKNKVFTFTGTISTETDSLHVINMAPEHNLILVKNDDGDYKVMSYDGDGTPPFKDELTLSDTFDSAPYLVAFDDNEYIVSGKADDKYDHYYYKDSSTKLSASGTNRDQLAKYQIVAMGVKSPNLIVVTNDGSIWQGAPANLEYKTKINLRGSSNTLYPSFVYGEYFYIQDIDRIFRAYDLSDGKSVNNDITKALNNEKAIKSFLVDNDDLYIGYIEIGLKVFDLGTQQFK
jgi:hypothetical protein